MCSIAGVVNYTCSREQLRDELEAMNQVQACRGPDGGEVWLDGRAGLAHRRLAVIDLSDRAAQPMSNESGDIQLVCNGEIYNCRELRTALERSGHVFRSDSDSECIIHLYEEYGDQAISKLHGMFALAVYDLKLRRLLLARDRVGKKPLVYFVSGSKLAFASTLDGLSRDADMPREFDMEALGEYFSLQYINAPRTIYRGVYKLRPGELLKFDLDSAALTRSFYWRRRRQLCGLGLADAAAELRRLTESAVLERLRADVPTGVFLSGGMDSSVVGAVAARSLSGRKLDAFTIGFEESAYDERFYARAAAKAINGVNASPVLDLHEKVVKPADFTLLEDLAGKLGEPFADSSILPTAQLCRFAREKSTVILSGDGADELFGGYDRYRFMKNAAKLDFLPEKWRKRFFTSLGAAFSDSGDRTPSGRLRRGLTLLGASAHERYLELLDRCPEPIGRRLFSGSLKNAAGNGAQSVAEEMEKSDASTLIARLMDADLGTYLPGDILTKVDQASMSCGLEVRSPFLDHRIVEFAAGLPDDFLIAGSRGKRIVKTAFAELLPQAVFNRRKQGFGVPVGEWLRGEWRNESGALLFDGELADSGLFDMDCVRELFDAHLERRADHSYLLWSLLMFGLFLRFGRR